MSIDFNQLREFLTAIAQTEIAELTLKDENFELTVRKGSMVTPKLEEPVSERTIPAPQKMLVPANVSEPSPPKAEKTWVEITSPMVGTFYRAPAPGEAPFVEVGDRVRIGQPVCIIEAMKLMNEIEAEISGQIMEILVENGEPVEYGQPLMQVTPD